jgi:hypothetical protein
MFLCHKNILTLVKTCPVNWVHYILWRTDRIVEKGIIIHCPEAIKFCERVNESEFQFKC